MNLLKFNISIILPKIPLKSHQLSHSFTIHLLPHLSKSIFFQYQFAFNFFLSNSSQIYCLIILSNSSQIYCLIISLNYEHFTLFNVPHNKQHQQTTYPLQFINPPIIHQDIVILKTIQFIPISNQDLSSNHRYIHKPLSFIYNVSFRFYITLFNH